MKRAEGRERKTTQKRISGKERGRKRFNSIAGKSAKGSTVARKLLKQLFNFKVCEAANMDGNFFKGSNR